MHCVTEGPRYHFFHNRLRDAVGDQDLARFRGQFHFIRSYIQRTLDLDGRAARVVANPPDADHIVEHLDGLPRILSETV